MHLDARANRARNVIQPLSGIYDFVRSVHLDARMIPPRHGMKCGDFLTCFFVQRVARYEGIPPRCVICDFVQQVARYEGLLW